MPLSGALRPWAGLLAWTGPLLLVAGFATTGVLDAAPWPRAAELALLAVLVALPAWAFSRWRGAPLATSIAGAWLLLHAGFAGVAATGAAVLVGALALLAGGWLLRGAAARDGVLALAAGLAVLAGTVGWLLPFEIHRQPLYLLVALPLLVLGRARIADAAQDLRRRWAAAVAAAPGAAAFAVAIAGAASASAWLPTVQFDDLAYHLGLPEQLLVHGYYRMDPASNVWALAPWGADVLHAIAAVIAGGEARGAINLVWMAVAMALLARLAAGAGASALHAWLAVPVLAATPLMHAQYAGMQTELPTLALLLGLALLVQRDAERPAGAQLRALAVFSGALCGLKAIVPLMVLPLLAWQLLRWRGRLPWAALPGAIVLGIAAGGSSYAYAWLLGGNPLLPLFNQWFGSPFYWPHALLDLRYIGTPGLDLPWRITFEGTTFFEGPAGTFGFHWLGLAGVALLGLALPRSRALCVCGLVGAALVLWQVQYQRYPLPALGVAWAGMVAALAAAGAVRRDALLLGALALANLAYAANAAPSLRGGAIAALVAQAGDPREVLAEHAPERLAAPWLREAAGKGYRVLLADLGRPFGAPFAGHAFVAGWYDYESELPLWDTLFKPAASYWVERAAATGASHVLVADAARTPAVDEALATLGAVRERSFGALVLHRIEAGWNDLPEASGGGRWTGAPATAVPGPHLLDYRIEIDCDDPAARGAVDVVARDAEGRVLARQRREVACPPGGPIPVTGTLHAEAAPAGVELALVTGAGQPASVRGSAAAVRLRADAMSRRDLALQRLRP